MDGGPQAGMVRRFAVQIEIMESSMRGGIVVIDRLIRLEEVLSYTGLSRSELYRKVQVGEFPGSVKVGVRAVRWRESEVEEWIAERPRTDMQ